MGIVADTYEKSSYALQTYSFQEWFGPLNNYFDQQPHVASLMPKQTSVLAKAKEIAQDMLDDAETAHKAGFAGRTQQGMPAWAGPPGLPETRPPQPEEPRGDIVNATA